MREIQIPVTVGGITFKNPFYVASGPTTKSVRQLQRIEETGWAAASIKLSIDPAPYINRKPRYSLFKDRDALAFTAEKRLTFQQGLKLIADAKPRLQDLKLMANITYAGDKGPAGWVDMAKGFEEVGADIIELNMCCPNMSYNLELTSGGTQHAEKQTGASMGQDAEIAAEIVSAIKEEIHIPLFVKLTPEGGQIARIAKALYAAGADAVGGTGNRLGMPPIDLEEPGKAFFHLQEEISMGCYCSSWLKPLAQRDTYEIRKVCGMEPSIMAAGGITNWRDAVEMVLCGGTLLGVCAETLISGYDIVRPMIQGLQDYMEEHGYTNLAQMRGLVVPQVRTATDVTIYDGYARIKEPTLSAPCKKACPHRVPVQAYVQKIGKGDYRAAYDMLTEGNPLQGLCALTCPHPCEDVCVRGGVDAPVKIRALEAFVMDYGKKQGWMPAWKPDWNNGKTVAVVGAGMNGLAAAAHLRRAGYGVTVFEREEKAGGYLRWAVPDYAGHKERLEMEIAGLEAAGISFVFGTEIADAEELSGFDMIYSATGANDSSERRLSEEIMPGWELAMDARGFLSDLNHGKNPCVGEQVAVIGSGMEAIDCARSAVRLGAKAVTLLYPTGLPARSGLRKALKLAQEEGVVLLEYTTVVQITPDKICFRKDSVGLQLPCTQVFAVQAYAERAVTGQGVYRSKEKITDVITAMSAGKNAAAEIDRWLQGEEATLSPILQVRSVNPEKVRRRKGYLEKDAHPLQMFLSAEQRKGTFAPYERMLTEEEAKKEAGRCLNCGCGEGCQLCKTICTDFAPEIVGTDTLHICKESCVACGMCFNRCPNDNIEMVKLGSGLC